jgi:hypothetical protein
LSSVKRLAEAAHLSRNREVADPHLAQIVIEVATKHIEEPLPDGRGYAVPTKAVQKQHQMQHNQLKPAFDRVRHPIILVKGR